MSTASETRGRFSGSPSRRDASSTAIMDLSFVTERILALSFPPEIESSVYRDALHQAANMLQTKHGDNYMVRSFYHFFSVYSIVCAWQCHATAMTVGPLIGVGCSIVLQLAVLSDDGTATKTNALFLFWIAFRMTCVQVFNLSLPRKEIGYCNSRVLDVGWPNQLAPPLERLCSVCRALDSWLQADPQHVAVLHSRSVS